MCGITGFYGDFDRSLLQRMSRIIAHRGPDAEGEWFDEKEPVGLAHRRLSIIDLSELGRQPMTDLSGRAIITYNGEIYNFKELRDSLVRDGYSFRSQSDTEVLINLYLRDGYDMLSQLNGIFAFALWDVRKESLFLARDGLGVKPLYYAETPAGFLFSSELKSILVDERVSRELDIDALHDYLTWLWRPAPGTMLKSVKKLPPGAALIVKNGRIEREWTFYDLPYGPNIENIEPDEAVELVRTALQEAVSRQMVADVPVGTFLSGGLDSSSVTALAREYVADGSMQCFTMGFKDRGMEDEGFVNDLPFAERAADHLGVALHTVHAGHEMAGRLEGMIWALDEPQADPAPINAWLISELAREHGIKVLLSGAGGDDIFTGYRRHFALLQEKYWSWLPVPVRRLMARAAGNIPSGRPLGRRLAKAFQMADKNENERIAGYFNWIMPELRNTLFEPGIVEHISRNGRDDPLMSSLQKLPAGTHALNRMLYLEGKHFLADHNLNYTDKMGMATGVEIRVPLLDPDLVALAAKLPVHLKQHGRTGKYIFKKAMEPYLPMDVIYRPKTGFPAPLRRWLHNELKDVVQDALSNESLKKRGLFNAAGVSKLLESDRAGRVDAAYPLFSIVCMELWLRLFVDRPASALSRRNA